MSGRVLWVATQAVHSKLPRVAESATLALAAWWLDTHPSTNDRIDAAKRENAPGVFHCDLPADVVFNGFDELCLSLQRRPSGDV
ncbi:hypothetical protein AYO47_01175 [Planctomyces sp. SCGC AG-212-M04]|nr:hypothetical protein AYO47_01175 [Planctomyces sp. SCGC AG-212-M04]